MLKGFRLTILNEIQNAKLNNKVINDTILAIKYNYSLVTIYRYIKDLEEKGYINKVKDGWFVLTYELTPKANNFLCHKERQILEKKKWIL